MLTKDQVSKLTTYSKLAVAHIRVKGLGGEGQPPAPTITPNTPEWIAWESYFRSTLGFMPVFMKRAKQTISQEVAVPAEWPEEFDGTYRPLEEDT